MGGSLGIGPQTIGGKSVLVDHSSQPIFSSICLSSNLSPAKPHPNYDYQRKLFKWWRRSWLEVDGSKSDLLESQN